MTGRISIGLWTLMGVLSVSIAIWSLRYLLPDTPLLPPDVAKNLLRHPWLVVHAGLASVALIVGPIQFVPKL